MSSAIVAEGIAKDYGTVRALDGLDLDVEEGTILGLLGPNGAGKTTAVRILSTLLAPSAGHASIAGLDVVRQADAVRHLIGLSGQYASVDQFLTGRENLIMFARFHRLGRKPARARADELLQRFCLTEVADRLVKTYSGGLRRRLDLAGSLIGSARVVFLDEPTAGLDPRSRLGMWETIAELVRQGVTLLLTTQYLEEADQLADQVLVIDHGRMVAKGTTDDLKARFGGQRLEVVVREPRMLDVALRALESLVAGTPEADGHPRRLVVPLRGGARRLGQVTQELEALGVVIDDIALRRPTLDEVFLTMTGDGAGEARPVLAGAEGRRG